MRKLTLAAIALATLMALTGPAMAIADNDNDHQGKPDAPGKNDCCGDQGNSTPGSHYISRPDGTLDRQTSRPDNFGQGQQGRAGANGGLNDRGQRDDGQ